MNSSVLFFIIIILMGCSHKISNFNSREELLADINEVAIKKDCILVLSESYRIHASNLVIKFDSTKWADPSTGSIKSIATSDIKQIEFTYHGAGMAEGFIIGAIIGGTFGYVLTALPSEDSSEDDFLQGAFDRASIVFSGLVGGGIGLPVGGLAGRTDIYNITPASHEQSASKKENLVPNKSLERTHMQASGDGQ